MKWLERHLAVGAVALIALVLLAHSTTFRDEVAAEIRYVERPYSGCRLPDPLLEYRITIEHQTAPGELVSSCYIAPFDGDESPAKTLQRLLKRTM